MAGYAARQSTYVTGDTIQASDTNDEFDAILAAFSSTTGHAHDGSAGESVPIILIGDAIATPLNKIQINTAGAAIDFFINVSAASVKQVYIADGGIFPVLTNDIDLGSDTLAFKDLYLTNTIIFEGATADAFETRIAVTDPTADRTWTIPDSASDTFVGLAATQTLTNKALTAPTITGVVAGTQTTATITTLTATTISGATTITSTSFVGDLTGNADTATTATSATTATTTTNWTMADESTDTTCFVAFVTAATGNLPGKTGTNLTFNSSTGILTATGFAGDITGNVTGNASGTAATVTGAAQTSITSLGTLTALDVDNININLNTITASTGALNLTPAAGSAIVLDGTINVDAGVVTGATSITSTTFVGNVTGNASGTAATVTGAAQASITSLGTLTTLTVDNITINTNTITADTGALNLTPAVGSAIVLDGTINVDAGVVTGATSITSTTFVGALTGNADTATTAPSGSNTGDEAAASATVAGIAELATDAEAITGTDTGRVVTPANMTAVIQAPGKFTGKTKGGDIASATTVVIDTDGDFFDITGTTGPIGTFTVAAGRLFTLQFDSTPTITDSATIALSGSADLVAAAGDVVTFYSTAANTVVEVSRTLAAAAAGAGLDYFRAAQSGSTTLASGAYTKIIFNTEVYDTASKYDPATNYRWTPGVGAVVLYLQVYFESPEANKFMQPAIYKNGALLKMTRTVPPGTVATAQGFMFIDLSDADDYYEAYCYNSATSTDTASIANSHFMGFRIS
jgi:hypothetical protein